MKNIQKFESFRPLQYSGGDVEKMSVIGTVTTKPIGPFESGEYKVVEIIKDTNGNDVYVCDFWYKGRIPQLIHSELAEEFIPSATNETSATGGPSSGGGVLARPSGLAGQNIGTSWASGGGDEEQARLKAPYNPSGTNRVFQDIGPNKIEMGKEHGPRTGKKSREKKLDLKSLKSMFARRQDYTAGEGEVERPSKVMSFDSFAKDDMNTIKKESLNDVVLVDRDLPIIAYQRDVEKGGLTLNNGYFTGTAIIGDESSKDRGSVDFSSPFHTGQVLHDDEEEMTEELDFRFHESIPENIVRKYLDEFVSKIYNGKIVKIYYH